MKSENNYIPINNKTYRRFIYGVAGVLKEYSYKHKVRKYAEFKRFKRDKDYKKRINEYYRKFNVKNIDCYDHFMYRHSCGVDSVKYIPEYMFYRYIEPVNSQLELARAYADKNLYKLKFGNIIKTPKSILRNINGIFFNEKYEEIYYETALNTLSNIEEKYIIKPSLYTGSGKSISSIEKKENNFYLGNDIISLEDILRRYKENFSVQENIKQNIEISKFNSNTVNSIKIFTARIDSDIIFMNSYARFGRKGVVTDNYGTGGLYCGVNKDGFLNDFAYHGYNGKFEVHPDSEYKFKGFKYPGFFEIIEKARELHKELPYFRFATWDMTYDNKDQPVLIEVNLLHQDISGYQLQNGPLFGEYTDRILSDTFLK